MVFSIQRCEMDVIGHCEQGTTVSYIAIVLFTKMYIHYLIETFVSVSYQTVIKGFD